MVRLLFLCLLVGVAFSLPIIEDPAAPEYEGNGFEGDMLEPFQDGYSGLLNTDRRWPGGVIVYKIDPALPASTRQNVETAMTRLKQETDKCIKFRQATSADGDIYVLIRPADGCSASVGYRPRTGHVNLSTKCSIGNIMHEFQHTLGVYHQQSRPDRDNYVSIKLENVIPGFEHAFTKMASSDVGVYGTAYDYGSQMHYGPTSFSKNGENTIVPKAGKVPNGVRLGQRDRMAPGDIAMLKAMYKC